MTPMTAADILREIETRQITLVPTLNGRIWHASIERVKIKKRFTKPDLEVVSAMDSSPAGAVRALIARLDGEPQQAALMEEYV